MLNTDAWLKGFTFGCLALFAVLATWVWRDLNPEYREVLIARASGPGEIGSLDAEGIRVRQIIVEGLNRIDRCTTCHLNVENPALAGSPQPFAYHPGLESHAPERFGCTVCHGGDGRATTMKASHGGIEIWNKPMLVGSYIQASCGKCHFEANVDGAPLLAVGRRLFDRYGCIGCHKLYKQGGLAGPDLTLVGSKPQLPEELPWGDYQGEKTLAKWFYLHFKDASGLTEGSTMTTFGMSDENARALTIFMLSLTDEKIPVDYLVGRRSPGR